MAKRHHDALSGFTSEYLLAGDDRSDRHHPQLFLRSIPEPVVEFERPVSDARIREEFRGPSKKERRQQMNACLHTFIEQELAGLIAAQAYDLKLAKAG